MVLAADRKERIWLAREVLRVVTKALKDRKLYGAEHGHSKAAFTEALSRTGTFLEVHGTLRVAVTKNALVMEDDKVHEDGDTNVAFRLFLSGARELKLDKGITAEEMDSLLGILGAADDADVSALFWEADFTHVELVCLNELAEGWDEPPDLSLEAQRKIQEMNRHADEIIETLKRRKIVGKGSQVYKATDGGREFERLQRLQVDSRPPSVDEDDDDDLVAVKPRHLKELQAEVAASGSDKLLESVVAAVLEGLTDDPESVGETAARRFLQEAPVGALRRRSVPLVASLLESYRKALAKAPPDRVAWALDPVFDHMGTSESQNRLVGAVRGEGLGGPHALCRVLATLGAKGVNVAVAGYLEAKTKEWRDALLEFLGKNAALAPQALERLLAPEVKAETVSWALFVISKNLKGTEAAQLYERAQAHPDTKVKEYATFLWRTQTSKGRIQAFVAALRSEDEAERIRAAETLRASGDPEALEGLMGAVEQPAFFTRSPEEMKAVLTAVADLGGPSAVAFLRRQSERPTWIWRRSGETFRQEITAQIRRISEQRSSA